MASTVSPSTLETTPALIIHKGSGVITFNGTDCFNPLGKPTGQDKHSFGGIPTVILIYFIIFWLVILLFSILRKTAWDYGRLALISDNASEAVDIPRTYKRSSSFTSSNERFVRDVGFCSWIMNTFTMKDSELQEQCGDDAMHYLSFQRHLIIILVVMSIMSVGIILPVNLSGSLLDNDPESFGRTTIGNIKIKNDILWVHTIFAVIYLLLTILVLRHHTSSMEYREDDVVKCTLFITRIPKEATEEIIARHLSEAYPMCTVLEVQLCYDVQRLMDLDAKRIKAGRSREYYSTLLENRGERVSINPKPCGHFCCCSFRGCEQVDAVEYYTKLESELQNKFIQEREVVGRKPLGLAFVTFQDETMATRVLRDFNNLRCHGCSCWAERQPSPYSQNLAVAKWSVTYAPAPQNVSWENLSVQGFHWWIRCFLINLLVFILLFFLTTPSIALSTIDQFNITRPIYYLNDPVINQFFPTLLLWTFSALLPSIVHYSSVAVGHWTRSSENRLTMHKVYTFLIIMVLILPSLGLTSLDFFFRWLFDKRFLEEGKVRFECVFLPDQGAFFVNYVIAAAFIGNSMELLRLPSLLLYTFRMLMAKSAAERKVVKQHQAYPFEFGLNYAWILCIFTVVTAYSITCPLIVPFGLIYILLRYLVDRYNLYYTYLPVKLNQRLHTAVVKQAAAAPIICLLWLLFFSILRGGLTAPTSIFTFTVVLLTIAICIVLSCSDSFKNFTINVMAMKLLSKETDTEGAARAWQSRAYVPKVLRATKTEKSHLDPQNHPTYGTMGNSSQLKEEDEPLPPDDVAPLDNIDNDRIYLVDSEDGQR
ncbi:CSC1-like protein 1 [Pristis pectinata]|uniref:CSC1-like protein 1 n=1 Tax=Pristis pectinata TaxID=685728 RepID=UPI00223D5CC2|nr:CSC1-like protein 1 [Pristis pectinata]XP_051880412.1 CSC1-like protein 1 [Pristis pectinata]